MNKIQQDRQPTHFIKITENAAEQRIDNFLFKTLKNIPKSLIYRWIRKGECRINKKRIKASTKLCIHDEVRIPPHEAPQAKERQIPSKACDLTELTLYEDAGLLVIDKPSGLAVHGGSGIQLGLIEQIRSNGPQYAAAELIHRIDRDTSGILLIAKKRRVLRDLHEQFRLNKVKKSYHAIVHGHPSSSVIDLPLRRDALKSGERMVVVDQTHGAPSKTIIRPITYSNETEICLLNVKPITGRTHQIRVHCCEIGHPIVGDKKYGEKSKGKGKLQLMLHASKIQFTHPVTEKKMVISSSLPKRFLNLLGEDVLNHAHKSEK